MIASALSLVLGPLILRMHTLLTLLLEKWMWLLFIFLLGHFRRSIKSYLCCRPKQAFISGLPTFVGQWLTSLSYHVISWKFVRDGYINEGILLSLKCCDQAALS